MWFLSGIVMMYVPFPSLTKADRLAGLAPIDWNQVHGIVRADAALQQGPNGPVWLGSSVSSASTGLAVGPVDARRAGDIATAFGNAPASDIERVQRDQWTVAGSFDRYRPLWKVTLHRPDGLTLYVASTTGTVVLDTNRTERFWNWVGSVPHWIYPTVLRQHQPLWRQVVLCTSGAGIVGAVSGMWIGVLRMRLRRRYKGGRVSPYRGWQWWHHLMGLFGGTMLVLWIASGWLSVDPNRWFASKGLGDAGLAAYAAAGMAPVIDWARLSATQQATGARQMRMIWTDGTPLLLLSRPGLQEAILDARNLKPAKLDPRRLTRAAERLLPGARIEAVDRLTRTDSYWYAAKGDVELPVLRVRFADSAKSWVHISPRTGAVLGDLDARRRLYRWLFDGLHRWDFGPLLNRRPLWDIWMLGWLTAGVVLSISGVVIGVRRMRKRRRR
ncbi:hypothetical protein WG907_03055 [Sphingobium sp. AN558]|uniref:hypothetical protein n=1 Tax=Sphingobium sp. AN558 TaxID=3133442 RepID=UPI0030C02BC8